MTVTITVPPDSAYPAIQMDDVDTTNIDNTQKAYRRGEGGNNGRPRRPFGKCRTRVLIVSPVSGREVGRLI